MAGSLRWRAGRTSRGTAPGGRERSLPHFQHLAHQGRHPGPVERDAAHQPLVRQGPALYLSWNRPRPKPRTVAAIFLATVSGLPM